MERDILRGFDVVSGADIDEVLNIHCLPRHVLEITAVHLSLSPSQPVWKEKIGRGCRTNVDYSERKVRRGFDSLVVEALRPHVLGERPGVRGEPCDSDAHVAIELEDLLLRGGHLIRRPLQSRQDHVATAAKTQRRTPLLYRLHGILHLPEFVIMKAVVHVQSYQSVGHYDYLHECSGVRV